MPCRNRGSDPDSSLIHADSHIESTFHFPFFPENPETTAGGVNSIGTSSCWRAQKCNFTKEIGVENTVLRIFRDPYAPGIRAHLVPARHRA